MDAFQKRDDPVTPRRTDEPPSPRVLKLALIGAAIILAIGILLYVKARHAPPALHDELQMRSLPASQEARAVRVRARITSHQQIPA